MIPTGPFPPRSRERFATHARSDLTPRPIEHPRRARSRPAAPGNSSLLDKLSCREREVLNLLALRYTDREISDALFISYRTVTTHVANILNKLGVNSRRDAAALLTRRDES